MKHDITPARPRSVPAERRDDVQVVEPAPRLPSFFGFRYSFTEVSLRGDRAHVTRRDARLEDGKLSTERFDGELPRADMERLLQETQQQLVQQTALWMQAMTAWLLPWGGGGRR